MTRHGTTTPRGGGRGAEEASAEEQPRRLQIVAPPYPKVVRYECSSGKIRCAKPARLYACGWRCDEHSPAAYSAREGQ